MILAYTELQALVDSGVIDGVRAGAINGTSVDVHLAGDFKFESTFNPEAVRTVHLGRRESPAFVSVTAPRGETVTLNPGEFVLANTVEVFHLPSDISAQFLLKSSVARAGLSHALATWADPTWNNSTLTLELHNLLRKHALMLEVGMPIGQMIFHRHAHVPAAASYANRGRYNDDQGTTAQKL